MVYTIQETLYWFVFIYHFIFPDAKSIVYSPASCPAVGIFKAEETWLLMEWGQREQSTQFISSLESDCPQ